MFRTIILAAETCRAWFVGLRRLHPLSFRLTSNRTGASDSVEVVTLPTWSVTTVGSGKLRNPQHSIRSSGMNSHIFCRNQREFGVRLILPMKIALFLPIALLTSLLSSSANGQVPQLISYQGRLSASGTNLCGPAELKFALVNGRGVETYWSNDGSSTQGSQPSSAVCLPVTNGLFTTAFSTCFWAT